MLNEKKVKALLLSKEETLNDVIKLAKRLGYIDNKMAQNTIKLNVAIRVMKGILNDDAFDILKNV